MSKTNKILAGISAVLIIIIIALLIIFLTGKSTKTYTITFNSNGGTIVEEQKVSQNQKVLKPQNPTRTGYIFVAWKNNDQIYNFNDPVTKDLILVAQWEKEIEEDEDNLITVRFDTDGGSTISKQTIEKGSKATKPEDPIKKDYKFVEWQLDDKKFDFDTELEETITLKAKWEKEEEKVTITFNSDGGSKVASQTIEKGKKATKPANPTKSGYTFTGWTLNGSTYDFNKTVNNNITLKATWKANSNNTNNNNTNTNNNNNPITIPLYTVSFNLDGGNGYAPPQTIEKGKKATRPANPSKSGYTFTGWTLNGNTYNFDAPVTNNITLKASWTPIPKTYVVKATIYDELIPFSKRLTVYENGSLISFQRILYTTGTVLCTSSNPIVGDDDLAGESTLRVVLNNGNTVTATLQK